MGYFFETILFGRDERIEEEWLGMDSFARDESIFDSSAYGNGNADGGKGSSEVYTRHGVTNCTFLM